MMVLANGSKWTSSPGKESSVGQGGPRWSVKAGPGGRPVCFSFQNYFHGEV